MTSKQNQPAPCKTYTNCEHKLQNKNGFHWTHKQDSLHFPVYYKSNANKSSLSCISSDELAHSTIRKILQRLCFKQDCPKQSTSEATVLRRRCKSKLKTEVYSRQVWETFFSLSECGICHNSQKQKTNTLNNRVAVIQFWRTGLATVVNA